jgi:hypothetical protein
VAFLAVLATGLVFADRGLAHAIGGSDAAFVKGVMGPDPLPFVYLGAKHMVTGYDHLLFLLGVIFFLYRFKQVALYVSLFSLGHSITLLAGVLLKLQVSSSLVDAVIGLSVVWKAFDNLGGFRTAFGVQPDNRLIVLGFGLVHGLGLATKLQALHINPHGLVVNLLSFNVGVEIGQVLALSLMLLVMTLWRRTKLFGPTAAWANVAIMAAGFTLALHQTANFILGEP